MDKYKLTHEYTFELIKAARKMSMDLADRQSHIEAIRTNLQRKALKVELTN